MNSTRAPERTGVSPPGSEPAARSALSWLKVFRLSRFSGIYLILLFILIFGLWVPDTFLTSTTLKNILSQESITAFVAIGLLFPLSVAAYDLSVGAMLGLSAMLSAWLVVDHSMSVVPVILIVLAVGVLVGVLNGILIVFVGVDSFIATLGMSSVLLAATLKVSGGQYISGIGKSFGNLATPQPLGIPILAFYLLALALVVWYLLEHTPVGRRMHATGANPDASRLAGVAVRKLRFWSLVASAVIASFAGILLASKLGSASPEQGSAYLLPVFAAALLGTTQIHPGRVNVAGTIVAFVLLAVGIKGLQLVGAESWVTQLFNGVALLVAVSAASLSKKSLRVPWRRRQSDPPAVAAPAGTD
jgi:ribose transport system permease protein